MKRYATVSVESTVSGRMNLCQYHIDENGVTYQLTNASVMVYVFEDDLISVLRAIWRDPSIMTVNVNSY
jgi:hypothetical protein